MSVPKIWVSPLLAAVLLNACTHVEPDTVSLFNGVDLSGWSGDPKVWRVEYGYISARASRIAQNTFLIHESVFSDFKLEFDVMLLEAGSFPNSGVQYRSKVLDPASWQVGGYQADIGPQAWGSLYEERGRGVLVAFDAAAQAVIKANEWNQYTIIAQGPRLEQRLNGVVTAVFNDTDETVRRGEGVIALQYHAPGENFEVRFRNIRAQRLAGK